MRYALLALIIGIFIGWNSGYKNKLDERAFNLVIECDGGTKALEWQAEKKWYRAKLWATQSPLGGL